jgi:hypothetical protein
VAGSRHRPLMPTGPGLGRAHSGISQRHKDALRVRLYQTSKAWAIMCTNSGARRHCSILEVWAELLQRACSWCPLEVKATLSGDFRQTEELQDDNCLKVHMSPDGPRMEDIIILSLISLGISRDCASWKFSACLTSTECPGLSFYTVQFKPNISELPRYERDAQ